MRMTMNATKAELACQATLEGWGFPAKRIPRSQSRTPDLVVNDGVHSYLIEVKTKLDGVDEICNRRSALVSGDIHEHKGELEKTNVMSGIVRDASDQLSQFNEEPVDFRLMWMVVCGLYGDEQWRKLETTLYGIRRILDLDEPSFARQCFFYTLSDFCRHAAVLDAAIISTEKGHRLCLNSLSARCSLLRSSKLFTLFGEAVCDPDELEKSGHALVVDCPDLNRRDEIAVMDYLKAKCGREKLVRLNRFVYSAETTLRLDDAGQ